MKFFSLIFFVVLLPYAAASEETLAVNLSACASQPCFTIMMQELSINDKVRVEAWADVVDISLNDSPSFYPLFNVFNETSEVLGVELGMQLLDKDRKVIAESFRQTEFLPYDPNGSEYEVYRTVGVIRLNEDSIKNTKYVTIQVTPLPLIKPE